MLDGRDDVFRPRLSGDAVDDWKTDAGICTNGTAPSVSSINRILRNRAAERAAAEFARAAGYGLYSAAAAAYPFPWGAAPLWHAAGLNAAGLHAAAAAAGSTSVSRSVSFHRLVG